jgi:hypothetical protein
LSFFFFILVNAALFIRPGEIFPDLENLPVYNVLILTCLATSLSAVLAQLSLRALVERPISICVLGLQLAVLLSHLSHLNLFYARIFGLEFFKVVLYYLLLVAVVNTSQRLRGFLSLLIGFITVITLVTVLHYHGMVVLPSMTHLERIEYDEHTGQLYDVVQLMSTGIFADPNDLCLALVMGMGLALYKITDRRKGLFRALWIGPLGLFAYALSLTHSRGGFLGMLAAMMGLFVARFGWKRSIPLAAVALPAMFVLFAGRQTNITTSTGTGQSRIQLWAYSLEVFWSAPVFGLGQGLLASEIGQEAHNSFVHCYADMGFFGGTLFIGMFYLVLRALRHLGRHQALIVDPELRRLHPYLVAVVTGYMGGMLSLSRAYIIPTYLVPGLVASYQHVVAADAPELSERFDQRTVRALVIAGIMFLFILRFYLRFGARWG